MTIAPDAMQTCIQTLMGPSSLEQIQLGLDFLVAL